MGRSWIFPADHSKNIKSYFLFFTNEINIFAIREILLIAENGPWKKLRITGL